MQYKIYLRCEFIKTESATAVQRAFRPRFNIQPPTRKSICHWNQFTSYLSLVVILKYRLTKLSPYFWITLYIYIYIKLKFTLERVTKTQRGSRGIAPLFFNLGARWGGWSAPRPGRFTSWKDPIPIVQLAGWTSEPVWTGAENLVATGIRSSDRPVRSESLYRLSYPGYLYIYISTVIPRLTKIIRSGITFVSRNVILYKLYKYIIHFILLNWKYVNNVFTIILPNFQSLFKVSSWNGPTVHVCCFMLARASTKTSVSRIHIR